MANPFFTNLLDLISGNRARASEVEANLSAVEAGFDGVYEYLTRALRGPQAGDTIAEMPSAASRANKVLVFDASGNPTMATPTDAMNAVNRSGDNMTGPLGLPANGLAVGANQLVVSGGNVGMGATPVYQLHQEAAAGTYHLLKSGNTAIVGILFGDTDSNTVGRVQYNHAAEVMQLFAGGIEVLRINGSNKNIESIAGGSLGYGAGSGGTAIQSTSKSTAVTLNKPSGVITTHNAALAAGATVGFNLNNSVVGLADGLVATITNANGVTVTNYRVEEAVLAAGVAFIQLTNISGGSLSESVAINFGIHKGSAS